MERPDHPRGRVNRATPQIEAFTYDGNPGKHAELEFPSANVAAKRLLPTLINIARLNANQRRLHF